MTDHDEPAVVARTIELRGFGPAKAGELVVIADGASHGGLLNGAFDEPLRAAAADLLAAGRPAAVHGFSVDATTAAFAGLTCGGTAEVLLQRHRTIPPAFWDDDVPVPRATVTRLVGEHAGATITTTSTGDADGSLGDDALDAAAIEVATAYLRWGGGGTTVVDHATLGRVLVDVRWTSARLLVVGPGDLGAHLRDVAYHLGWRAHVTGDPTDAVARLEHATQADTVVVLSHDPDVDTPVLAAALQSEVSYVGALGSRRTQAARRRRLVAAGCTDEHLARLRGPAGLDIGAAGPAEIALSIVAEIVAVRAGRTGEPLKDASGPIQPHRAT